ncbi:MAG: bi-domain-containing oxidoreductase [Bacteroidales bacterium]|jgi:predicted dehydrogenase/threonine dehydrogenase-like Zn-dependent dehydrogenase
MKQAFIIKGKAVPIDIPSPTVKKGFLKIKVAFSAVSKGTELKTVIGTGKSLISRAIEDPTTLYRVLEIVKSNGLKSAKNKVTSASEKLNSIGYSIAGQVLEVGDGVVDIKVGDLVAAGGSGFAVHAEEVVVPKNLVVKVPSGMDLMKASTATIGSIALHGVRRADLKIGEYGVVFGVGLLGLLAIQILKTSGIKTACVDINTKRLLLAKQLGADFVVNALEEDPVLAIRNWTSGYGADAVLFMAATDKDEPLSQAFQMCRRKGKVVLVGVSGMHIKREDMFKDEIDFLISTSYGPGRYDSTYELDGHDYPYSYVRWTENRNMAEFLNLINTNIIRLDILKPVIYNVDEVAVAYNKIEENPENHILIFLKYEDFDETRSNKAIVVNVPKRIKKEKICIGLIGAGSFATSTLLPIILDNSDKFQLKTIVNSTGDKAINVARQFKAEKASSNPDDVFNDPDINLVMICTRHNNHAELVLKSLQQNKHVFVEKPLATTMEELENIEKFYSNSTTHEHPILMVGFNRRYCQYAIEIKHMLANRISPVLLRYRMNPGYIPYDNWVHEDGGRIVGEACHIIDLMLFLTESDVTDFAVSSFNSNGGKFKSTDNRSINLTFKDGSIAAIDYFACGSKFLSKEYLEVHFDNKSIILDDYRSLKGYGIKVNNLESSISKKGHNEEWQTLYQALKNGQWPISLESLLQTTRLSIQVSK